ncbi:hypothetical protein FGIG_02578 [Fasciola gigantica]|uniref:Ig-like domain-containing protein n=1 Tax=Fasciola gigantica TaxID=46835 RepID=A0A504YKH0_FASGI|nr:hypothetical protein FGIG_02578 [Fasciola gigantica]
MKLTEFVVRFICLMTCVNIIPAKIWEANTVLFNSSSFLIGAWIRADLNNSHLKAPTIVQSSVRRTVVELGANVTIFCQWIASPRAVVTWYRGLPIPRETDCCADANVRLMPASAIRNLKPRTSQLVFHNFRDKDMDEYTCRVKNSLGTASRTMGVLVQGRAPITMKPKNQTVKEGVSSVLFHCRIITETEFTRYNWLKNGRHLSLYPGLQHRYKIFSNGTLLLLSINRSDIGLYTCVADDESNANQQEFRSDAEVMSSHRRPTHRLGKKGEGFSYFPYPGLQWTASAKLDVHFPPEAHMAKMQPIYLGFNGPGRLPCTVTANPRVEFIEWEKIRNVTTTRSHKPLPSLNTSVVSSPDNAIQRVWPVLIGVDQLGVRKDPVSTELRKGTIVRELPKSATVTRKSYLRLKVTESMHTGLALYCVASNLIGRVMTPVNVTARHSAPVISSQFSYSPVEMVNLHVQPQSFGAWLIWDWKTRPFRLIGAADADQDDRSKLAEHFPSTSSSSPSPTCHTVVYHRIVRTREKWISYLAPERPIGLKVLFTPTDSEVPGTKTNSSAHAAWLALQWIPQKFTRDKTINKPRSSESFPSKFRDQILPVLHETIVREQQTFRNMTDTFTLDEPVAEIAAISDSSNTTSTNGIVLDVPERFWYGLSYFLLAVLILCAIFLTAYAVRQTLQRKGKKQRVLDRSENQEVLNVQSNDSSKFILTNQIRPTQLDESSDDPSGFALYTKSEDVKRLQTKEACLVHARCSTPNWNNLRQFTQERRCSPLLSRSYMSREDDTHEACNQITVGTMSPHQHTVWTDVHKLRCSSSKPARHPFERRFPGLVEIKPGGTSSRENVKLVDLLPGNMPHLEITSDVNPTYQPVVKQTSSVLNNPSNYSTLSWIETMEPTRPTTVQSCHMDSPPANPHAAYVVLPVNPINQELKGETLRISCVPFVTECVSLYATMDPNNQTPTSSILVEDSILSISHEHPIDTCLLMQTPVWHGSHIRTNPS